MRVIPVIAGPGDDIWLDASGTFDSEHGSGSMEVEWDLDGDGIYDTAPDGNLVYVANFYTSGTRFIRARITDPAGDVAISAPVAVTIVPCATSLSPTNRSHGYSFSTNFVTVAAGPKCIWTGTTTNDWIKPLSGSTAGSGQFLYYTEPNPFFAERRGSVSIGDSTLSVVQGPAVCTYSVTASRFHGRGVGTGSFKVTTKDNCEWYVINTNSWIQITSSLRGTNTDNVSYSILENNSSSSRSGYLVVTGELCKVTQWGQNCEVVITPESRLHSENSETGAVSISTSSGCVWNVGNTNDWITLTTPVSGTTSSSIGYSNAPNLGLNARVGLFTINDQTFVITQQACVYVLSQTSTNHGYLSETGTVAVTAGPICAWNIGNTNNWITILSPSINSGTGTGEVTYVILPNGLSQQRAGTITIAGIAYDISQDGKPCQILLTGLEGEDPEFAHGEESDFGLFLVHADTGCSWTPVSTVPWVTIFDAGSGTGESTVFYAVEANTGPARSGTILVEEEEYVITQPSGIRTLTAPDTYLTSGETTMIPFVFEAHGSENRLAFSLCFDTNLLGFVSANLQAGAPFGLSLILNTNEAFDGTVGFTIAMQNSGWSIPAGTSTVVQVSFRAGNATGKPVTTISACDSPVARSLIDAVNRPLTVQISSPSVQM
ncbi:MAG TPA: BACON domain-containing carbohydrate-binding protein, partial [Candidatus Acidoferrum sp.]|nr:BACON domain-containing carbohydrate-binding protein [Candidatus Acidoferrum sp.]